MADQDKENYVRNDKKVPQMGVQRSFLDNRRKVKPIKRLNQVNNNNDKIKGTEDNYVKLASPLPIQKPRQYFPTSLLHNEPYRQDIWKYLLEKEETYPKPKPAYMLKQKDISWNDRSIVLNWLIEIAEEFNYHEQTFHLTANYIDRFISKIAVKSNKFQLVGVVAMGLATKIEEYDSITLKKWSYITAKTYTPNEIYKMEITMLKILDFYMHPPTIYEFIQYLSTEYKMDKKVLHMAMFIADLTILEGSFYLNHSPSKLAASAIILARCLMNKLNHWPVQLRQMSGHRLEDIAPIIMKLYEILKNYPKTRWQAVYDKYKCDKHSKVALIDVKDLMLTDLIEECNEIIIEDKDKSSVFYFILILCCIFCIFLNFYITATFYKHY